MSLVLLRLDVSGWVSTHGEPPLLSGEVDRRMGEGYKDGTGGGRRGEEVCFSPLGCKVDKLINGGKRKIKKKKTLSKD